MTSGGQPPAGRWWEGSVQDGKTTGFTTLVCMYICMYNVHAYLYIVGVTSCIVWWSRLLQSTMHGFTLELVAFIALLHDQHLCVCVCVGLWYCLQFPPAGSEREVLFTLPLQWMGLQ